LHIFVNKKNNTNYSLLKWFYPRERKMISGLIYVLKIKILSHLQYENLYFCYVSLTIRKTIHNTTIHFINKFSSKSYYVWKVYKTKLGIYTQPNDMDGWRHFTLITLYLHFQKILLDKHVSFIYSSFWTCIFSTTHFGPNTFHFSAQTHVGRRLSQSLYNPHCNPLTNFDFETSEYKWV